MMHGRITTISLVYVSYSCFVHVHKCMNISLYICIYSVYLYVCMYVQCMKYATRLKFMYCVRMYVLMYVCMYIRLNCMYVCMYVCM